MPATHDAGTSRAWPEPLIIAACEMRERGLTVQQIVLKTGIPHSTIDWHCIKRGAEPPKVRQSSYTPRAFVRNGRPVTPFTAEQDATIQAMSADGHGYTAIGNAVGRNPSSVRNRLMILARRELRAELAREAA